MESKLNATNVEEEIQVYRNNFYSGVVLLVKKLFMI